VERQVCTGSLCVSVCVVSILHLSVDDDGGGDDDDDAS